VQLAFQIRWNSFPNRAVSGWCCPSVQTVALLLHAIAITRLGVRTVLPWRPDGCNSSPRLALSRKASRRVRPVVRMVAVVFPYLCQRRKSFYRWTLTGVQMVLPRHLNGCTWTHDSSGTLKSIQPRCCDVRTNASLNSLKLLDTDGSSDVLVFVLATFCWTKSLLCNVAAFTGMLLYSESTL
jgi:hypothetical protein